MEGYRVAVHCGEEKKKRSTWIPRRSDEERWIERVAKEALGKNVARTHGAIRCTNGTRCPRSRSPHIQRLQRGSQSVPTRSKWAAGDSHLEVDRTGKN